MNRPTLLSRFVRHVLLALYRLRGWRVEGRAPPMPKFIVVGVYAADMARIAASIAPTFTTKRALR